VRLIDVKVLLFFQNFQNFQNIQTFQNFQNISGNGSTFIYYFPKMSEPALKRQKIATHQERLANALLYELFCVEYLRRTTRYTVYHWKEVTDSHIIAAGIAKFYAAIRNNRRKRREEGAPFREYGLDGMAYDALLACYVLLQFKFWHARLLSASKLATFLEVVATGHESGCSGLLIASIGTNFELPPYIDYKMLPFTPPTIQREVPVYVELPPARPYQVDALNALAAPWQGFVVLSMPCGTGKSWIMLHHAFTVDKIIITFPTCALVDQFKEYAFPHMEKREYKCLVVDADGAGTTRNPRTVRDTWGSPKCFILCTCESFKDVIAENINRTESSICMMDEAHNMTKDIQDIATDLFPRVLLATATPFSTWTFPTIYHMSCATAISDHWVTDFRVFVPIVEGEMVSELEAATRFYIDGLFRYGRHAMCFTTTIKDCDKMKENIRHYAKTYHFIDIWIGTITCRTTPSRRKIVLAEYAEQCAAGKYAILVVPQLLSEGFDSVHVDTIMLRPCCDISLVQRLSRANRMDPMRPSKVATVLLWVPDENAPKTLHALKSHDPDYYKKVYKMSTRIYNDDTDTITEMAHESSTSIQFQNTCKVQRVTPEEKDDYLQSRIEKLASYIEEHQKLPPQGTHELGHFANHLRQGHGYKISSAQHDLLVDAWSSFFIVKKQAKPGEIPFYEALLHYLSTEKKIPPQTTKIDFQDFSDIAIGAYLKNLKKPNSSLRANLGAAKKAALLALMPTIFDKHNMKYENKVAILKQYIETNRETPPGTASRKVEYENKYGFNIGKFWADMKRLKKIPADIQALL
jgi:superfamily II DNA or RNA helicase